MRTRHLLTAICAIIVLFFAQDVVAQKKGKETVKFYVAGMNCKNCQAKIEKNIAFEKGVSDLKCDLETKTVEVTYKTDKTNPEKLSEGFDKIGMPVKVIESKKIDNQEKK